MERCATGHAAHAEHILLLPLAHDVGKCFVPIDLRFYAPVVALRNECLSDFDTHLAFPMLNILPNRALTQIAAWNFCQQSLPDPVRGVALFARRLPVGDENLIDLLPDGVDLPGASPIRLTPPR